MAVPDLAEIYAIQLLKHRYMRAVDTQDWILMEQCFVEDSDVWYGDGLYTFTGRDDIIAFFANTLNASFVSSHFALHPEIEITGPITATGIWRMQDLVFFTAANPNARESDFVGGERLEGAGYYYDDYVKVGDDWKIKSSGYVRLFDVVSPKTDRPGEHFKAEAKRGVR